MASISPITDAISAPPNTALVLPPSGGYQASGSSATAQTEQTAESGSANAATFAGQTQTTNPSASNAGSLDNTSAQPLDLVFDALATAELDTAIDQTLLSPPTAQASGTFSTFMDQLFAIAAQQAASQQAQAAAATTADAQTAAAATAEFARNASSATANSALEGNVQQLANQAQAANAGDSTVSTPASTDAAHAVAAELRRIRRECRRQLECCQPADVPASTGDQSAHGAIAARQSRRFAVVGFEPSHARVVARLYPFERLSAREVSARILPEHGRGATRQDRCSV